MKFLLSSLVAVSAAIATMAVPLTSDSKAGQKLLSQAVQLNAPEGRQLNDQNYYTSWMTKYSMKFDGCHSLPQFERDEGMRSMLLAKFKMCPTDNCGKCPNSGEYIVEMRSFVEAYQEAKMSMNEYACQAQQENCQYLCENGMYTYGNAANDDNDDYYNNGNNNNNNNGNNNNNNNQNDDDYCYYQCMSDNEMSYCDNDNNNNNNNGNDFNMDEFMECRQLGGDDGGNNNNNYQYGNNNYQRYYQGAYCNSGGVYLGVFSDSSCTKLAPSGTFEKYYGYSLPTDNLVGTDCISCKSPDNGDNNNNNNNNNQNYNNNAYYQDYYGDEEVFDVCEELYEEAGKCETNLDTQYKNNGACDLMHGTLKRLDAAYHNKRRPAVGLAWFFGLSCCFLGAYVFWLHSKVLTRQQINLLPSLQGTTA